MEIITIVIITFGIIIFLCILRNFINGPFTKLKNNLNNSIVIITGSNSGIGFETAEELLKRGALVIFACRDEKKTYEVIQEKINKQYFEKCVFIKLDLSKLSSIKNFVLEFKSKFNKLDILINNAGVMFSEYRETEEGFESCIGVNFIGHLFLTVLLLDYFIPKGRIINVSSIGYRLYKPYTEFNNEIMKNEFNFLKQYSISKLGIIIFTKNLADYINYKNLNLKTVSLNPGNVSTEAQGKINLWYIRILYTIFYPFVLYFFKTPLAGAQTTIHLALLNYEKITSGAYYDDLKERKLGNNANDSEYRQQFMNMTKNYILQKIEIEQLQDAPEIKNYLEFIN